MHDMASNAEKVLNQFSHPSFNDLEPRTGNVCAQALHEAASHTTEMEMAAGRVKASILESDHRRKVSVKQAQPLAP